MTPAHKYVKDFESAAAASAYSIMLTGIMDRITSDKMELGLNHLSSTLASKHVNEEPIVPPPTSIQIQMIHTNARAHLVNEEDSTHKCQKNSTCCVLLWYWGTRRSSKIHKEDLVPRNPWDVCNIGTRLSHHHPRCLRARYHPHRPRLSPDVHLLDRLQVQGKFTFCIDGGGMRS